MTLYSFVLFVHVTAVLALSATLSFEALSLFHLRHASSLSEIQRWMDPVPGLRWIAISSMVLLLVSGIYLAATDLSIGHGMAQSDDRSSSAYCAVWRINWQAPACHPAGLRRRQND